VKPDPEAFKKILSDNNLRGKECLYFDDSAANITTAARVGIQAISFTTSEELINSINELIS